MNVNSSDFIKINFVKYLDSLGLSPKSHKNYRSDLNHFTGWAILKIRSFGSYIETLSEAVPFLSKSIVNEYRTYLAENNIPIKTINRRLSTLRHFSKSLLLSNSVDINFMDGIENVSEGGVKHASSLPLLEEFRSYLEAEKVSASTIKNYTSDVRQFLTWLELNNQIYKSTN